MVKAFTWSSNALGLSQKAQFQVADPHLANAAEVCQLHPHTTQLTTL